MRGPELTPRLRAAAELVERGSCLADIGTDHAYLPVWLLLEGRIRRAIAADLRPGPLSRARATAQRYGCTRGIDFRLCDGLSGLSAGEADTIVIAGMGGETIARILEGASWVREGAITLILQPMSAQQELRRWLWRSGFCLDREEIVCEGEKLYNIVVARFGGAVPLALGEEWAGRQYPGLDQPLRGRYLRRLLEKTDRALAGLAQSRDAGADPRREELLRLRRELEDMEKEWNTWQQ